MNRNWRLLPIAALLWAAGGCSRTVSARNEPQGWPAVLRFNLTVSQEDPDVRARRIAPIRAYLEREMGMPVEITASSGYGACIEAMRARKIDVAGMGPFAYLIASEKAGVEAIAARGDLATGAHGEYAGALAVSGRSPLRTIDDVRARSKELTLSFVDPASASGHLVQRAYLDSVGIVPERDFKKVMFSNNHIASIMAVRAGKVDVAAVQSTYPDALVLKGKLKPGDVRLIWTSPPIPTSPVAVRKDLPAELKRRLQSALVAMRTKAPEVYANWNASSLRPRRSGSSFIPVGDADFEELRRMARSVRHVQLLEQQ